jgi:hypothetical protein
MQKKRLIPGFPTPRRRKATGVPLFVSIMLTAFTQPAHAQINLDTPNGMATPVDFYGNAQALHPERRPLEIFQNDVQKKILGGYQTLNRPMSQRGFGTSFALPSDQFMKTMLGRQRPGFALPSMGQQRPNVFGLQERERKAAFSSYGGFGQRRSPYAPGDAEGLFARKRSLIAATGSTAPIERSKLNRGGLGSIRFPIAQTPFQAQQPVGLETTEPTSGTDDNKSSLSRFLTSESQVLHDRALSEGWKQFEAGDYRAAIRTFESAAMLDEKDAEARIATVFSYVSLGSFRAAFVSLDAIRRRDKNIFGYDVSMPGKFGIGTMAQQVRLTAQGMAEASEQSVEMKALAIYVLWYMDGKDDALRAAKSLAGKDANRALADWPGFMQAALARPPTNP